MTGAADRLAALPPDAHAASLAALDEISRPMTRAEIEDSLIGVLSRSQRRALSFALKGWSIIALHPAP